MTRTKSNLLRNVLPSVAAALIAVSAAGCRTPPSGGGPATDSPPAEAPTAPEAPSAPAEAPATDSREGDAEPEAGYESTTHPVVPTNPSERSIQKIDQIEDGMKPLTSVPSKKDTSS